MRVTDKGQLAPLMGSKYGQSDTGLCMREAKRDLECGLTVLYCGTPCQIAGLKAFLKKGYERLYCFDILCHGTPSRLLEKKHIAESEAKHGSRVIRRAYRDKAYGWRNYTIANVFANGETERESCYSSQFMRGFVSDIALNESCYACPYKKAGDYKSDITAGDCWGARRIFHPFWKHRQGISVICTHTEKGDRLLRQAGVRLHKLSEREALGMNERFLKGNMELPLARKPYLDALKDDNAPLADINRKFLQVFRQKRDVAITGMWMHRNYGGLLTSFALYKTVRSMGLETTLLDNMACYPCNDHRDVFWQFLLHEGVHTTATPTLRSAMPLADATRILLVGSDQAWNAYNEDLPFYLLDFAKADNIKLSYATSFGGRYTGGGYSEDTLARCRRYFQRFDAISVRETGALDAMREQFGVKAVLNLDPVFLPGGTFWSALADKGSYDTSGQPYLLSYILDPDQEKRNAIVRFAQQNGISRMINIYDIQATIPPPPEAEGMQSSDIQGPTVYDWLKLLRDSHHVITDSFHGCCFSIIFNKNFLAMGNANRGSDRFDSLLGIVGLSNRLAGSSASLAMSDEGIDYQKVNAMLDGMAESSREWLRHYLLRYERPEKLQRLNEEAERALPPVRCFKLEAKRLLMRKLPQLFLLKKKLKQFLPH